MEKAQYPTNNRLSTYKFVLAEYYMEAIAGQQQLWPTL